MSEINLKAVILAGGQGTRFWPISRQKRPKQFLSISASGESLIQATARRAEKLGSGVSIMVVTNHLHEQLVRAEIPHAAIVSEPLARNTAASIGLGALLARRDQPECVMIVLPADHAIGDEEKLLRVWREAAELAAQEDVLVTIGVKPTFPHTGYGYIKRGPKLAGHGFMVSRFFEKPNLERATQYFESPEFFWNSGMFVWKAETILAAIREFMPELAEGLERIEKALDTPQQASVIREVFSTLEPVSIDFGVLEHARNCAVIGGEPFGWNDVGSWDAWAEHFEKDGEGNLTRGEALVLDSRRCVVYSEHRLTAVLGAEDLIVIDAGDSLLVCPRSRVQDVKLIVEELKKRGRADLT